MFSDVTFNGINGSPKVPVPLATHGGLQPTRAFRRHADRRRRRPAGATAVEATHSQCCDPSCDVEGLRAHTWERRTQGRPQALFFQAPSPGDAKAVTTRVCSGTRHRIDATATVKDRLIL